MPVTTPSGAPASASTGPCSTCSSRNAHGSASPRATSARLPTQPTSSPRNDDDRSRARPARPPRSPPTTPSAPSKRPPCGTVSRCEPTQTSGLGSGRAPDEVAVGVDLDLEPRLAHPAGGELDAPRPRPGEPCGRFAPGPPPIAYSCSSRSRMLTRVRVACRICTDSSACRASGTASVRPRCHRTRSALTLLSPRLRHASKAEHRLAPRPRHDELDLDRTTDPAIALRR